MLGLLAALLLGAGATVGVYLVLMSVLRTIAARRLDRRLQEVSLSGDATEDDAALVKRPDRGPLPALDKVMAGTAVGTSITKLIEQSGTRTTPSALVVMILASAAAAAVVASFFIRRPLAIGVAAVFGGVAPVVWLFNRRSARLKRFEEQFPEALDLMSRAIRAGHAFQTAMGMVADELDAPVGPEFKRSFDQQNFGLPLRDALGQLADRVPNLDVRFFVTAVMIQRDTGGNLSEILDNLAHVVRERFKIRRQVRVHTAHGRFTGYVLLALPAALAVALMFINPEHMNLLFREPMGQMMVATAVVLQTIGFIWIRQVIKIEV
jgi:tight adherence protein B